MSIVENRVRPRHVPTSLEGGNKRRAKRPAHPRLLDGAGVALKVAANHKVRPNLPETPREGREDGEVGFLHGLANDQVHRPKGNGGAVLPNGGGNHAPRGGAEDGPP